VQQCGVLYTQYTALDGSPQMCVRVRVPVPVPVPALMLVFLKEGTKCLGEKLASTVDDTLDEYLIALQQKNR